jgi:hypothetical protein
MAIRMVWRKVPWMVLLTVPPMVLMMA